MGTKTQKLSNIVDQIVEWQSVFTGDGSTGLTAVAGRGYFIDTTSGTVTVTLPASPKIGDTISIRDYAGTFGTNNVTVDRNGQNLGGVSFDGLLETNNTFVTYVYVDSTKGWITLEAEAKSNPISGLFTEATGGTVTTSGDYKIHTFTGDGCFVVSQIGNNTATPTGGPDTVSYLVLAGGGAGGAPDAGGGGAGGFREGRDIAPSYTASPLVAPTGLTITAQTYPVTVGAGGAGKNSSPPCARGKGGDGSNSVFATITSAGGGGGGANLSPQPVNKGQDGGSGGGGGRDGLAGNCAGAGNTPPVSPPQGNSGGTSPPGGWTGGGGGGGAGAAGTGGSGGTPSTEVAGNGGNGVSSSITGSSVTRGGGGGGSAAGTSPPSAGVGGSGGGGQGSICQPGSPTQSADAGTANLGGGGGGAHGCSGASGAGGKGIVVIRYKFQ